MALELETFFELFFENINKIYESYKTNTEQHTHLYIDTSINMNKILCNTEVGLYKNLWQTHYDKLIDDIYNLALKSGSSGGKLLGAGGGGFFLFYVPKENHDKFKSTFLKKKLNINFNLENTGSTILKF